MNTDPVDPLARLLEVQDRDLALDRLRVRRAGLPERAELASVEERVAAIDAKQSAARGRRQELASRQADLEGEVAGSTERIAVIERRLYGGEVSASRELQAMSEEVKSLERRRSQLEDRIVEIMEESEPVDEELSALEGDRSGLEAEAGRLRAAIAEAEGVIDAEAAAESEARAGLATGLPADLTATYERLRTRLGGIGAARLVNGSCGGCHLSLPSAELDRVRKAPPDAVLTCEQCGRILVR
jgi:predicted  nucleic acid-binding Zn-ribbon protein